MHSAEKALNIRPGKRDELFEWFGKQPEAVRVQIMKNKIRLYHEWASRKRKENELPQEMADYAALLAAIMDAWRGHAEGKKLKDFELRVAVAKEKKKARTAPTATLIEEQFLPMISKLRNEGLSWRQVAGFIRTHHHKKFAHTYLAKIYGQWVSAEKKCK
jgi:hypothetical protein